MNSEQKMIRARASLILRHPFWGALLLNLKLVQDASRETMATDGESLQYNSDWVESLSEVHLEGVCAHEVSHCAHSHHTRRGKRDPALWNAACDYAINPGLLAAGFSLPDPLHDPRFNNMSADEIYAVLLREEEEAGEAGAEQHIPASDPGGCGEVIDAAPAHEPAQLARIEADWRVKVMQAMSAEAASHPGEVPSNLKRMFESIRKRPVDWREMLRRYINETNRTDTSWMRPNKRLLGQGFIIPGMIPNGINQIGVVLDTSGSVDQRALSRFMHELQAALDDSQTKKITVICCDTEVKQRYDFEEGDKISIDVRGGGGTSFHPAISWFSNNEPDIAALIYFTDLDCSAYGDEPWVPVMWLGYGPANVIRDRAAKVPFGEVIHLID